MKQSVKIIIAVVVIGLAAGVLAWQLRNSQNTKLGFQFRVSPSPFKKWW